MVRKKTKNWKKLKMLIIMNVLKNIFYKEKKNAKNKDRNLSKQKTNTKTH